MRANFYCSQKIHTVNWKELKVLKEKVLTEFYFEWQVFFFVSTPPIPTCDPKYMWPKMCSLCTNKFRYYFVLLWRRCVFQDLRKMQVDFSSKRCHSLGKVNLFEKRLENKVYGCGVGVNGDMGRWKTIKTTRRKWLRL